MKRNTKSPDLCHPEPQAKDLESLSLTMPRQGILTMLLLLFVAMLHAPELPAQEPDHASMHAANATPLHLTTKVAIPAEASRPVYRPARCDEQGNIYFRAYQPEERKVPVIRADAQGKTMRYSLDQDPAFANATAYDVSVLPDGKLFQPVQAGKDVFIVAFDDKGGIRWKTRLEKQFWVSRLIAFDDKSFLVIGAEPQSPDAPKSARVYQPVVAIFDRNGKLVRDVSLVRTTGARGDEEKDAAAGESQKPPRDEPNQPSGKKTSPPLLAVLSSDGQAGADGKVYLMVHSEPPVVYAIDSAGVVVSSWELAPPAERMVAVSMSLVKNRLAVLFRHSFQGMSHGEDIISVFDPAHAAKVSQFSVPTDLATSALGCFRQNEAIFVGPDATSLAIQYATPAKR